MVVLSSVNKPFFRTLSRLSNPMLSKIVAVLKRDNVLCETVQKLRVS